MTRLISLSRTGRYVAVRSTAGLELVDALGTAPRIQIGEAQDFACAGTMLWVLAVGGETIHRYALASGREVEPAIALPHVGNALIADRGTTAHAAIVTGASPVLALETTVMPIAITTSAAFPLGGTRIAAIVDGALRILELGRRDPVIATLRLKGELRAVHALYGGRVLAVLSRIGDDDVWSVLRTDGTLVHKLITPRAERWAVAGDAGVALTIADDGTRWLWVDLRYGKVRAEGLPPFAVTDVDISSDAQYVAFGCEAPAPRFAHIPSVELMSRSNRPVEPVIVVEDRTIEAPTTDLGSETVLETVSDLGDGPGSERVLETVSDAPDVSDVVPLALGAPLPPLTSRASSQWPPYASAREHLDDMLDLVTARAARAIADAWNSGRLSATTDLQPEREVRALLGHSPGFAPGELGEADQRLVAMAARTAGRVRSTIAAGVRLPFIELLRELDLSPMAGHVLMVALAPSERGEIARLFGILGGKRERPMVDRCSVDRFLLETVLAGCDRSRRAGVADELSDGSPLRRHGVLHVASEPAAFESITVDPVVIARLCERAGATREVRPFAELRLTPPQSVRALVDAVSRPRPAGDPLRLVLRGRRGSGRRSAIAALAVRVGRTIADIDCARLPRAGAAMAVALQHELRRAVLRGCTPVVSGLELADPSDAEGQDRIRQVIRAHPGPIAIRTATESTLPIDAGFETVALEPLSETQRAAFWSAALDRAGLAAPDVAGLAARWRIGPGQIEDVIAQVKTRGDGTSLDEVARQHIAARLAHVATPVRRLADWEQVALADDVIDSIREFIGRVAQRKTVFEHWGFDSKITSARGLTALFYGPPGTGKSMVAGLIARELGLELYRVDLSRIVSKWIGETEKNLSEVFDAAEDGQVVILFDEADSLFAKRTEVKTSVDRYANLEVNYLLQRLDSFEGVAILTTNLDGSIDPAFKRRMSLRLQFPFPDEDMRKRLWAAHIPAQAPIAGDFNFDELARRFPLSGGYIRNSTLRAAFLAAQERRPLSHDHLLRAIALEYRELGKLATDGKLE